jgi:hypothetical protein
MGLKELKDKDEWRSEEKIKWEKVI